MEIGGGKSTNLIQFALKQNDLQFNHICVEPYEKLEVSKSNNIEIITEKIEDVGLDLARLLRSGDLVFIDSSHVIRPQGDVLYEYLELLPNVPNGVNIHIHDIYTPLDYPKNMIQNEVRFWNEQYLLEAILVNSDKYKVLAGLNFLKNNSFRELSLICTHLTKEYEPGSIYLKKLM